MIVMDAPPPQEDVRPFVQVAGLLLAAGLNAPRVLEADTDEGFLLLSDLGHTPYLDALRQPFDAEDEAFFAGLVPAGHASTPGYTDAQYPVTGRVPRSDARAVLAGACGGGLPSAASVLRASRRR